MHYFQLFLGCLIIMGKNIEMAHSMDAFKETMINGQDWRMRNFIETDMHSFVDFQNDISAINQTNELFFHEANSNNLFSPDFFLKNETLIIESQGEKSLTRLLGLVMIQPSEQPGVGFLRYTIDRFFASKEQEYQIMNAILYQWATKIAETKTPCYNNAPLERIDVLVSPHNTELMHLLEHYNFAESEADIEDIQIDLFGLDMSDYIEGEEKTCDLFRSNKTVNTLKKDTCYQLIDVDSVFRCFSLSSTTQHINYHFSFYLN